MSRGIEIMKALLTGKAIVIIKSPDRDNKRIVDVMVGNDFSRNEAINSLASTLKAIAY